MRTSKTSRQQEWEILRLNAANGRMLHKNDIKRYMQLKDEFSKLASMCQTNLKALKTLDTQYPKSEKIEG